MDYGEVRYLDSLCWSGFQKFDTEFCKVEAIFGGVSLIDLALSGSEEGD